MKKIINSKKIKYLVFTMLGIIIGSSIGITANYLLKAEDVEYVDKDNNSTTVQNAITDLYNKASSGGYGELTLGTVTKTHNSITIPYTGNYNTIGCMYGTGSGYGSAGTIKNNACELKELSPNTSYNYRIIAADNNGKIYETHDTIQTEGAPSVVYLDAPIEIYFNPVTNQKCNSADYTSSNSNTGIKTGCMKWYAYKKEGNDYSLLLDHNTTATVPYNTTNSNENYGTESGNIGYDLQELTSTSGWNSSLNPRLISAEEVEAVTGVTKGSFFNGSSSGQTPGSNVYSWLFDYTYNCTNYGCNTADSSTYGYWTSSKYSSNSNDMWIVCFRGGWEIYGAIATDYGLRPVITVSNSILNLS